jgi:hypothetical protein
MTVEYGRVCGDKSTELFDVIRQPSVVPILTLKDHFAISPSGFSAPGMVYRPKKGIPWNVPQQIRELCRRGHSQ